MSKLIELAEDIGSRKSEKKNLQASFLDSLRNKREAAGKHQEMVEITAASFEGITEALEDLGDKVTKTRIVNLPSTQKITGTVQAPDLLEAMQLVGESVAALANKLDGLETKLEAMATSMTDKTVTVTNLHEAPTVTIPEYPKQIKSEITALPKYVSEGLERIAKSLATQKPAQVTVEKTEVDLSPAIEMLGELQKLLSDLVDKKVETDYGPILNGLKEVTNSVNGLEFPVTSFKSSWNHSYTMQSQDQPMTIAYTTVASRKVVSYVEVLIGTDTYRRTYTYDSDGDAISATTWVKQ